MILSHPTKVDIIGYLCDLCNVHWGPKFGGAVINIPFNTFVTQMTGGEITGQLVDNRLTREMDEQIDSL